MVRMSFKSEHFESRAVVALIRSQSVAPIKYAKKPIKLVFFVKVDVGAVLENKTNMEW